MVTELVNVNNTDWGASKASASKAVIVYTDGVDIKAFAIEINGETVDIGASVIIHASYSEGMKVAYLEDNKVIAAYHDNSNDNIYAKVLTLTGLVIAQGAEAEIKTNSDGGVAIASVSSAKAVVLYKDVDGYAKVLDIVGTTIDNIGAETSFAPNLNGNLVAASIGSKIIAAYSNDGGPNFLEAVLLYNITTVFDVTAAEPINAYSHNNEFGLSPIPNENAVIIAYHNSTATTGFTSRKISESGNILSVHPSDTYNHSSSIQSTNQRIGLVCNSEAGRIGFSQDTPASGLYLGFSISGNSVLFEETPIDWDDIGANTWTYLGVNLSSSLSLFFAESGNLYVFVLTLPITVEAAILYWGFNNLVNNAEIIVNE